MTMSPEREEKEMKVKILKCNNSVEMGGTYDYFNEKDRWQFLSKELQ